MDGEGGGERGERNEKSKAEPKAEHARRRGCTARKSRMEGTATKDGRTEPEGTMLESTTGKRKRETPNGEPKRRKEPSKDPMEETEKRKDRKDESNEGDQDGRNDESPEKGVAKDNPNRNDTKPWKRTKKREPKSHTRTKKERKREEDIYPGDRNKKGNYSTVYNGPTKHLEEKTKEQMEAKLTRPKGRPCR